MIINRSHMLGKSIGFFNRQGQLGIGLIIEIHSHFEIDVLFESKILKLRIKRIAADGSLWITNDPFLPYAQILSGDTNEQSIR